MKRTAFCDEYIFYLLFLVKGNTSKYIYIFTRTWCKHIFGCSGGIVFLHCRSSATNHRQRTTYAETKWRKLWRWLQIRWWAFYMMSLLRLVVCSERSGPFLQIRWWAFYMMSLLRLANDWAPLSTAIIVTRTQQAATATKSESGSRRPDQDDNGGASPWRKQRSSRWIRYPLAPWSLWRDDAKAPIQARRWQTVQLAASTNGTDRSSRHIAVLRIAKFETIAGRYHRGTDE